MRFMWDDLNHVIGADACDPGERAVQVGDLNRGIGADVRGTGERAIKVERPQSWHRRRPARCRRTCD